MYTRGKQARDGFDARGGRQESRKSWIRGGGRGRRAWQEQIVDLGDEIRAPPTGLFSRQIVLPPLFSSFILYPCRAFFSRAIQFTRENVIGWLFHRSSRRREHAKILDILGRSFRRQLRFSL